MGKLRKKCWIGHTLTRRTHTCVPANQPIKSATFFLLSKEEDRDLNVVYYIIDRIGASSVPYQDTFSAPLGVRRTVFCLSFITTAIDVYSYSMGVVYYIGGITK